MSEYMGLILGKYEAKEEGFMPGGELANISQLNCLLIQEDRCTA